MPKFKSLAAPAFKNEKLENAQNWPFCHILSHIGKLLVYVAVVPTSDATGSTRESNATSHTGDATGGAGDAAGRTGDATGRSEDATGQAEYATDWAGDATDRAGDATGWAGDAIAPTEASTASNRIQVDGMMQCTHNL